MKAKRNLFVSLFTLMLLLCCSMLFVACNDEGGTGGGGSNPTYTVTFKVDGRNYDIALVEKGKTVTLPVDPEKDGYTFDGWFDEDDNVVTVANEDVTLTAKWTVNTYTITYTDTNGVENVNPTTFTVEDCPIEIADLADTENETFLGWSYMDGTPVKGYTLSSVFSDVELKAVWDTKLEYKGLKYYTSTDGKSIIVTGVTDTSITEITVPDETYLILDGAFKDCTSLKSLNIPFVGTKKDDTQNAKLSDLFGGTVPSTLKNVTIRGGGTIPKESFKKCTSITTLTLTGDVQTIEESAFEDCTSLDLLYMQDSEITTVGKSAFAGCKRLVLVKLPAVGLSNI